MAAILAQTLDVTLPPEVTLRTYASRAAFKRGLTRDAGLSRQVAVDLSAGAVGVALPRTVMLLDSDDDSDRVRLVAHELMHVVQYDLAGPAAQPAQWLMEGSAEWAAFTVLDHLGGPGVLARRERARVAARTYLTAHPEFTPAAVQRSSDFRGWQRRVGDLLAYQVAYALAQELVDRTGASGLVAYFRALRAGRNHTASFEFAFATPPAAFMADVRAGIEPQPAAAPAVPATPQRTPA